jgi:thiol-disulfide isomerase/thioredoxin
MNTLALLTGLWIGLLQMAGPELPFRFEIKESEGRLHFIIHNAEERIDCDEISMEGDSLFVTLPLYNSEFRLRTYPDSITGVWINRGRKIPATLSFRAYRNEGNRFAGTDPKAGELSGRWETWFDAGTPDSSLAIGLFRSQGAALYGTFLTETGDHRFLEGNTKGDSVFLSVFDGSHCWLYRMKQNGNSIEGMFYSGNHHQARFYARRNDSIQLRDPGSLTLTEGNIGFRFLSTDSTWISLTDSRYRNKVVLLQIMGSWCPNCMDESVFLDSVYRARKEEGFEVIALAFERNPDPALALPGLRRMKKRLGIHYPVLLAGESGKAGVMKQLPFIRDFLSFPTSILINREGQVVDVHTGFSGPATGKAWEEYQAKFRRTLDRTLR